MLALWTLSPALLNMSDDAEYRPGRRAKRGSHARTRERYVAIVIGPKSLFNNSTEDTIDEALVFCQTCRHGGHAEHILEWFYGDEGGKAHETCPVASCQCQCANGS